MNKRILVLLAAVLLLAVGCGGSERNIDFVSSGERKRKSPNRVACNPGFGLRKRPWTLTEWHWKDHP